MWLEIDIQLEALAIEWPKPAEGSSEVDERRYAAAMEMVSEQ
jgi:nucleoid-associated protein YgaU